MDKVAETLYNLSDNFANLFQLTNQMNSTLNIGKVNSYFIKICFEICLILLIFKE